jgi:hypothetical protein
MQVYNILLNINNNEILYKSIVGVNNKKIYIDMVNSSQEA